MRPLNVLMLIDRLRDTGGAERLVTGLAIHMPADRCRVTVCTTRSSSGRLTRSLDSAGVRRVSLGRESRFDPIAFRRLVSFLRAEDIDVLHAHKLGPNAWGAVCGRLARTPVVVAHEHGAGERGLALRLNARLVGGLADAIVVGSTGDRDRLVDSEHVPPDKVMLIPGAYIPRPQPVTGDLRAELGIPPDAPVVGTIAVLRAEKALDVLVDAFARLSSSLPEARLIICGRGPSGPPLARRATRLGLDDRVLLVGHREDIGSVLSSVDVAAISSDREGASLFALECMAHSTPLVSTDVGGPHDFLEDGISALLVPPQDPELLGDALESLLCDPERGRELAAAAHERLDQLTIDAVALRFVELYERLLARAVD